MFPEAILPIRVVQPRSLTAVDKAVNHVDAPCMIGVVRVTCPCSAAFVQALFLMAIHQCQVHVYQHTNDGHHAIASVGTTAEVYFS